MSAGKNQAPEVLAALQDFAYTVSKEQGDDFMSLSNMLEQRGERRGIEQGIQQGTFKTLERQLTRKFGSISDQERNRLQTMTDEELQELSDRIIDGDDRDKLFN